MTSVCEMMRFGLLLLASFLSSSAFPYHSVFIDPSNCVHLRCEWRGVGEHCKPATSLSRAYQPGIGRAFRFLNKDESDTDLLSRLKLRYPVNTFTIVKDSELGEMCEDRQLWCNTAGSYDDEDYDKFLLRLRKLLPGERPKFRC